MKFRRRDEIRQIRNEHGKVFRTLRDVAGDAFCFAVMLGADFLFFYKAILYGEIFFERDTRVFYYPMMASFSADIRNWHLPLWTPDIFAGFPIFADGEAGLFYPPVMALFYFLTPKQAFIWTTVAHFFMAGLFTFAFLRSLRLARFASLVGGIVFMFGGFSVAQLHHVNISNGMVWLPLVLYFVERALQSPGPRRHVNLLLAGGALGMQALTLHVNVVLMSLPVILAYIAYRIVFRGQGTGVRGQGIWDGRLSTERGHHGVGGLPPDPRPLSPIPAPVPYRWYDGTVDFARRLAIAGRVVLGRLALLVWALSVVPLVGLSLGAVKLLPLYELGTFSQRAGGVSSAVAASQSLPVYNFATLIFPYFFRDASNIGWGLWSSWETRIYVGILPLMLALTAIILVRSRLVLFFALAAAGAVLVGLGDSSPINLYGFVSSLPGYNLIRAPGRYSFIWTFSVAVLAAHGANWLHNPTMGRSHRRFLRDKWRPVKLLGLFRPALALVLFALFAAAAIELPLALQRASEFVAGHRREVLDLVQQHYLSLPRMPRMPEYALTPGRVYDALVYSLSFDSPSTRYGLIMVAASAAMIIVGYMLRRARWLWQTAAVILVAGNLIIVGWQFHPTIQIDQLSSVSPAADFLQKQRGLHRVYGRAGTSTEPNLLLPAGIEEADGYSSLPYDRLAQYVAKMDLVDNQLMDLLNIRYIVSRNRYTPQPSYEYVIFHPDRPILASKWGNPASKVSYGFPTARYDRVRVLSHLRSADQVPQGTPVAEISLFDENGGRVTANLLAGVHTAEWAYDRPDVKAVVKHSKPPRVAFDWPEAGAANHLYYAELRFDRPVAARRVEVSSLSPSIDLQLFGLTLVDSATGKAQVATRNENERFKVVYRDAQVVVRENLRVLPRAFLVPEVRVIDQPKRIVDAMSTEPFDARKTVIVEERDPIVESFQKMGREGTTSAGEGAVRIESYKPEQVRLSADTEADAFLVLSDSFYPGWHATVDGKETKIYRANYLFRAIMVPQGKHDILFYFAPASFQRGFLITLTTALLVLAAWSGLKLARLIPIGKLACSGLYRLGVKLRSRLKPKPQDSPTAG
ncbi:MAG: YfhO family protein [Chloroflexi bacterium]|nr:YfhO family protein [Chloroflexota bacterium]